MRKIEFVLMLSVVCAFGAVAAASASAEEAIGWLQSGLALTNAVAVDSAGTLVFVDHDNSTSVECPVTDLGSVGPGIEDLIESITMGTCKFLVAGECAAAGPLKVSSLHLFWLTLLELVSGVLLDMIEPETGGNPGWLLECESKNFAGVTATDECTVALTYAKVANEAGFVDLLFEDELGPLANCDTVALGSLILEGINTGLVEGLVEILAESGLEITANAA
jgi:hypothetical protein